MMNSDFSRLLTLAVIGGLCATPVAAVAQGADDDAAQTETIHGTISSIQNLNHLFVADDRGFTDDVTIRSGAEVPSTGAGLEPGRRVTIVGTASGKTFLASSISTASEGYATASSAPPAAQSQPSSSAAQPYPEAVPYPAPAYYPAYYPYPVYYPAPVYYGPAYYRYRPYFPVSVGLFFHFR
jgi:hypothetical protein